MFGINIVNENRGEYRYYIENGKLYEEEYQHHCIN
jgi:hypothetical protein